MILAGVLPLALNLILATAPTTEQGGDTTQPGIQTFGSEPWMLVRRVDQINPAVLAALSRRCFPGDRRIANPGAAFNPTDVVNRHPRRRLLLAGHLTSRWFVQQRRNRRRCGDRSFNGCRD